jgi:hypothetical protein
MRKSYLSGGKRKCRTEFAKFAESVRRSFSEKFRNGKTGKAERLESFAPMTRTRFAFNVSARKRKA